MMSTMYKAKLTHIFSGTQDLSMEQIMYYKHYYTMTQGQNNQMPH